MIHCGQEYWTSSFLRRLPRTVGIFFSSRIKLRSTALTKPEALDAFIWRVSLTASFTAAESGTLSRYSSWYRLIRRISATAGVSFATGFFE